MKIRLTCPPEYENLIPEPQLSNGQIPDWFRQMPASVSSEVLAGADIRTVKQCPPFIDAMQLGIVFPLMADVSVDKGEFSWDWWLPPQSSTNATRSPIGVHVPEQASGYPGVDTGQFVIKFNNFWMLELPEGWSMYFTHPVNRTDLPFHTLSGLVDCDRWNSGFVHFPALWIDADFAGVLAAGTPVAQAWPVKREALELDFIPMDDERLKQHQRVQQQMQQQPGIYRKSYRAEK